MERNEIRSQMENGDYVNVVVNAIGDCLSAVPIAGAFITAVKNTGYNIAAAKQKNRIISLLNDLSSKVENIEVIFNQKREDDAFLVLFYRFLYSARDEIDEIRREAFLNLGKKLLEEDLPFDETRLAIETLPSMTPYEVKLLAYIAQLAPDWKDADEVAKEIVAKRSLAIEDPEEIKHLLSQLWKKGLVMESHHGARLGTTSSDFIEKFLISKIGQQLLTLISSV